MNQGSFFKRLRNQIVNFFCSNNNNKANTQQSKEQNSQQYNKCETKFNLNLPEQSIQNINQTNQVNYYQNRRKRSFQSSIQKQIGERGLYISEKPKQKREQEQQAMQRGIERGKLINNEERQLKGARMSESKTIEQKKKLLKTEEGTFYPYTHESVMSQLKRKPSEDEKTFNKGQCYQRIDEELASMKLYTYDFISTRDLLSKHQNQSQGWKAKRYSRKVKFHFECSCGNNWNSIVGTFQIMFTCHRLRYNIIPNRMKCERCQKWANPLIFESQLQAVKKGFCLLIAKIVHEIKPPKHEDNRYKLVEDMHNHKEESCEACIKGKCFAYAKRMNEREKEQLQRKKARTRRELGEDADQY